jgi:glucose-1-phosphate adenylyltransferase
MNVPALPPGTTQRTLAIIMGGGAGTRLFPLTKDRAKPAVPLGGKYRLVDIPISNCLNSTALDLTLTSSIACLYTDYSASQVDRLSRSFVDTGGATNPGRLAMGTRDGRRGPPEHALLPERLFEYYIILSGDQLYGWTCARSSISTFAQAPISPWDETDPRSLVAEFGIMHSGVDRCITRFVEKPKEAALLHEMQLSPELLGSIGLGEKEELYQASMGIYVFNRDVLVECLNNNLVDFGKHIIPEAIKTRHVSAHIFNGYWEDIGTIRAFYEANLDLTDILPEYSFFDAEAPIYTHPRFLPGSKVNGATLRQAIISDGCIISDAHLERSVIGVRSIIQSGATIRNSIVMGADYFEQDQPPDAALPPIGIGRNCGD